jgi:hypothetical protein
LCLSLLSTLVGAGALLAGAAVVSGGAAEEAAPAEGAAEPAKPGDEAACPEEAGVVGADAVAAGADEFPGEDDAEEPDAADEETAAGVAAPPDGPYPVGVLRGANWLPANSMTPSTAPVSSVIVDVSSFTSAGTRQARARVQRRR